MNRKTIFAFVLVLALVVGCMTTAAYADGESLDNPRKMDYHDIDASVYEGVWVSTGLGFDVYLPVDWVVADIAQEQADAGLVFLAGEDGGGANLTVVLAEAPEGYDYEALGQELAASNTAAVYADLNGLSAVVFENEDTAVSGFCMLTEAGRLISGVVSAPSDDQYDAYTPTIKNIVISVSPTLPELYWEDYKDDAKEIDPDGDFVTLDDVGVKVWVFSFLQQEELTDEDLANSYIAFFADAKHETALSVFYHEGMTMAQYAEAVGKTEGCSEPMMGLINGLQAFTYTDTEYDTFNVVFSAGSDCLEFTFWPVSDEDFSFLMDFMSASIQLA